MSHEAFEFRPSGTLAFEHIEPAALAKELNEAAKEVVVVDALSITYGLAQDCKPSAADRMLAGSTIDWLLAFPAEARPKALCDRFPHVANRLAKEWLQASLVMQSLQTLVADARWGNAGFPAQVQGELQRLQLQLSRA